MRRTVASLVLVLALAVRVFGQEATPASTPQKRGWLGRMFHPFSSTSIPQYKDPKLRGLAHNHAITEKPGTVLINPQEHIEYNEMIATRDLTPNKVFIAEVFFPQYPELRIRQKFLTAP